jgi:hypothetical protein
VLDHGIGWPRLVQARVDVEALAATAVDDPLLGAAERYSGVRRYAPALLEAFTFRSGTVAGRCRPKCRSVISRRR